MGNPQRYTEQGVRDEQTEWRDESISKRHRKWGFDCPAVDIDFLMIEYNQGRPVAIVEYKHEGTKIPSGMDKTFEAIRVLCDGYKGGDLPFLIAWYNPKNWIFRIRPMNSAARLFYGDADRSLSEVEYVRSLYTMRGKKLKSVDEKILNNIGVEDNDQ